MKITVCELPNDQGAFDDAWRSLADHVAAEASELLLLPEMPFSRWLAATPQMSAEAWRRSVEDHDAWLARLGELGADRVLGTRPVIAHGTRFNQAFAWANGAAVNGAHHRKRYLPDEAGFWEATWYARGDNAFDVDDVDGVRVGFAICTELWFHAHAREYGKHGIDVIASPRATLDTTTDKWLAGGRVSAVVSGAFSVSSNFSGSAGEHGQWGGHGWIIDPEEGDVLGVTTADAPFLTCDVDLGRADAAKLTYPRSVAG